MRFRIKSALPVGWDGGGIVGSAMSQIFRIGCFPCIRPKLVH